MKKIHPVLICLLSISIIGSVELFAKCPSNVKKGKSKHSVSSSDVSGYLRRLEEESEDMARKMRNADPRTKSGLNLFHKRDELSMKIVHECQNYLFRYNNKNDSRTRKIRMMMKSEAASLLDTVGKIKNFPCPEAIMDYSNALYELRRGKIKYSRRLPSSDSALLKDIQKDQRNALDEYYKGLKRQRR